MIKRAFSTLTKTAPLTVTDNAWTKMFEISKKQGISNFLFSATSGGCHGYNYELSLLNQKDLSIKPIKPTYVSKQNIHVVMDPLSEFLLLGTTIDYTSTAFDNKFIFIPDKELASSCGCGISFTPKH
jgi:iron-sulfur cluster assembly accessory protein